MKQTVKLKRTLVLLFIGTLSLTTSCSSDGQNDSKQTTTIIGKWTWGTAEGNCISYREFKTNHILTYVQYFDDCKIQTADNLSYKVINNEIIYDDPTKNEKIIEMSENNMTTTFQDSYSGLQTRTYTRIP